MTEYAFHRLDDSYVRRAREAGEAESIARIHAENLANFGVLPLTCTEPDDCGQLDKGTTLRISALHNTLRNRSSECDIQLGDDNTIRVRYDLSSRRVDILLAGGSIPWEQRQLTEAIPARGD
jgi:aconitate hydratase